MKKNANKLIFILLLFFVFIAKSCKDDFFYKDYVEIKSRTWEISEKAFFKVNIEKPKDLYQIFIDIDCNEDFPTNNLWLAVEVKSPSGINQRDTVMYNISDETGKWYGEKSGKTIQYKFLYKKDISFPKEGEYTFQIEHLMRENDLPSVSNIGISIARNEKI
jgi:gliding motility-associated lipoprotein GldH